MPMLSKVSLFLLAALLPASISVRMLSKEEPIQYTVQQIWNYMKKEPEDVEVQQNACSGLHMLGRESFQNLDKNGRGRIMTKLLEEGIGEALAYGLLNILASEQPFDNITVAATYCMAGIQDLGDVLNDTWAKTFLQHAPSLVRASVKYVVRIQQEKPSAVSQVMAFVKPWISMPEAIPALRDTGSFNLLLELLQDNTISRATEQSVWGVLQGVVEASESGALLLANHGGPGQGIELIMRAMRQANSELLSLLQFETVGTAKAVLLRDDANKTFLQAFVRAGLLESVLKSMQDWPISRGHQDHCCQIIKQATDGNVTNQGIVVGLGALELMAADLAAFSEDPLHPRDGVFSPVHSCSAALLNIARGLPASRQDMLRLGVPERLDHSAHNLNIEFWKSPWNSSGSFPFSNVITLKDLLLEGKH